jgi:hypothetical protein
MRVGKVEKSNQINNQLKNKNMKKTILLFVFLSLVISSNVKSNPISPPPVTIELYFDANNNWFIELDFITWGPSVSDSLVLMTSTDTVPFKPGFTIHQNTPFIITVDSLKSPLTINKNGDFVMVWWKNDRTIFDMDAGYPLFAYGNIANAQVSAPFLGQSIKRLECTNDTGDPIYYIVKDDKTELGTPYVVTDDSSSFSGHVYDSNHNPLPGVTLNPVILDCSAPYTTDVVTDANGYYDATSLYSYIRSITIQKQFCNSIDTTFSIEPNSNTVINFTLDSCTVGLKDFSNADNYSMQIFPNPGSENFTFQITTPALMNENCLIKIYNSTGELVNIIPVNNIHNSFASISWDGKGKYNTLAAGVYTCVFSINGKTVTSEKLIIEK